MRKTLALCASAGLAAPATAQTFKMTHNVVDDFVEETTVLCTAGGGATGLLQHTRENHIWRQFELSEFGLGEITVREVEFGIQRFFAPSHGGTTDVTINLYEGPAGARPVRGLRLIGTATRAYQDQTLTLVRMPLEACVDAGISLVVEIVPQDFTGSTMGDSAWIGSNSLGETDPSYLASAACGFPEPSTYPEIGCAECLEPIAIIMNIYGDEGHDCAGACYADCDESGALDFFDFLCFQNQFAAGEPDADCDQSGELDFFDFLCFQNAFAAGCL